MMGVSRNDASHPVWSALRCVRLVASVERNAVWSLRLIGGSSLNSHSLAYLTSDHELKDSVLASVSNDLKYEIGKKRPWRCGASNTAPFTVLLDMLV